MGTREFVLSCLWLILKILPEIWPIYGALLSWTLYVTDDIAAYRLERSTDHVNFTMIDSIPNNGKNNLSYPDPQIIEGTTYYRLQLVLRIRPGPYSAIVVLTRAVDNSLQISGIQPNPVVDGFECWIVLKKQDANKYTGL